MNGARISGILPLLPDRLMVGREPLEFQILVRFQVRQLTRYEKRNRD